MKFASRKGRWETALFRFITHGRYPIEPGYFFVGFRYAAVPNMVKMPKDDQTLLREYAQDRSEAAFAALVERHLKLVYSAALRRLQEPHLAQDVAQNVFIELARKPWSVREPQALAGWLYRAASHTASNVLRRETRRRQREMTAMSQITTGPDGSKWHYLQPQVDEAIHTLSAVDQNIIALRYFEGRSLRETGQSLSLTEDAVQKRASRALEKLRSFFSRRGFTLTAAAVAALLLDSNSQAAIPPGLPGVITQKAILAAASSTGIAASLMKLATSFKTMLAVGMTAGMAAVALLMLSRLTPANPAVRNPASPVAPPSPLTNLTTPMFAQGLAGSPRSAGAARASQPASVAQNETRWVKLSGYVVDDETGQPVNDYALEWGVADFPTPGTLAWGFSTDASARQNGKFKVEMGMETNFQRAWLRVHADGYVPQPVTLEPFTVPIELTNLVVRLHRGGQVWGIVLDHSGQPVPGARVFLAGNQLLNLTDGKPDFFKGSTTTTAADGRFSLNGAGGAAPRIVVVSDLVQVWMAPTNESGQDMRIVLPEPASLLIRYDIPHEADRTQLRIELKTWQNPDWKGVMAVIKPFVTNRGELLLTNLAPGSYDFVREKQMTMGNVGRGAILDRSTLLLQSGKVANVDCVRTNGFPVTGQIAGITNLDVPGAYIYVHPAGATGNPRDSHDINLPCFDALTSGEAGRFQTAQLVPGTYTVVAEAYRPETPEEMSRSGIRLPTYVGTAQITVPDVVPPEPVTIQLQPSSP